MKPFEKDSRTVRCAECGLTYYVRDALQKGKWLGLRNWLCQECVDEQLERNAPPSRPGRAARLPFGFHCVFN